MSPNLATVNAMAQVFYDTLSSKLINMKAMQFYKTSANLYKSTITMQINFNNLIIITKVCYKLYSLWHSLAI